MTEKPFISVILPTRNRPQLKEALNSLAAQTSKDFEICLVDNQSKNPTSEEIRAMLDAAGIPFKYVRTEESFEYAPYNLGLAFAEGDYVIFFSDDDTYGHSFIEAVKANLTANPQTVWLHGDATVIIEGREPCDREVRDYSCYPPRAMLVDFRGGIFPFQGTCVYKRSVIVELGGMRPLYYCEDFDLWLRLLAKGHKPCKLQFPYLNYFDHQGKHMDRAKKDVALVKSLTDFRDSLENTGLRHEASAYLRSVKLRVFAKKLLAKFGLRKYEVRL